MNECLTDEIIQSQFQFTFAYLRVIVVDEDIDPLNFDQESRLNKENIKILRWRPSSRFIDFHSVEIKKIYW